MNAFSSPGAEGAGAAFPVRPLTPVDLPLCETLIRDAYWNVYHPGCIEHLIWHRAHAGHPDLIPSLSLVAELGGDLVGCIMGTRGRLDGNHRGDEAGLTVLGPVAVSPEHQRRGIGTALVRAFVDAARAAGEDGVFLYGNPDFYSRVGFADATFHGIHDADGANFPQFMGLELRPGSLDNVVGDLHESSVYQVSDADVDAFDARFEPRDKQKISTQIFE